MGQPLGATLRMLRPMPHLLAFYDGRIDGVRAWSEAPNWLDDGAYALGISSYAIIDGTEALLFDTHISPAHARIIRETLQVEGVTSIRVVVSHWHDDHVAGNVIFQDCEIIANRLTAMALETHRTALETADPPIKPLILPNRIFDGTLTLTVGSIAVELRQIDIHSHDGMVLFLPQNGTLLAGDVVEDPVTYVAEAEHLATHLQELQRLSRWPITRILPSHGAPDIIAAGGYDTTLIEATRIYTERLLDLRSSPARADETLLEFARDLFASGAIRHYGAYDEVHRRNVAAMLALPPL